MPQVVRVASLLAVSWYWSAGSARGAEPEAGAGERQRIDYEAPATCATAQVFQDEVQGRTPRLRLTVGADWTSRFEVAVRDEGERFVGAVTVHADKSRSERREVSARSCEEVLETLSLIVAVAIDPNASLARRPKRQDATAPAPTLAAARAPAVLPAPALAPAVPPAPAPTPRATWRYGAVLGAEARGAFASDAALAGVLAIELEQTFPSRWGWSVRLSGLRSLESEIRDPFERRARFQWTAARLDGALGLLDVAGRVALAAGVGFDVGAVEAESVLSKTRPWVSGLTFLRVRWWLLPPLGLEATAGALIPFTRDRFVLFDPDTTVYRERGLLGFAGLSLCLRLH